MAVTGFIGGGFPRPKFLTSVISTTNQITAPAVKTGDLMVLADFAMQSGGGAPTNVVPANFTQIITSTLISTARLTTSFKLVLADASSATLTGMNGNFSNRKILCVFRGGKKAVSAIAKSAVQVSVASDPTAQIVPASAGATSLIVLGFYGAYIAGVGSGTLIDPRTMSVSGTDVKDGEVSNEPNGANEDSSSLWVAFKSYYAPSVAPDVTVDMDHEGQNFLQSCYIEVS